MPFSGVSDESPKKLKQGLLIPLSNELLKEQTGNSGGQSSTSSRSSKYLTTKKRNRLRLHDRKSVNDKDGWAQQGGYMNAKRQKLEKQFQSNIHKEIFNAGESTNIFQHISIYVDGYTKPSSDELRRLMMLHGGHHEVYLSKEKVTHIIATNLPDSKIVSLRNYKVVHPDWILKSIEAGRLLSYTSFQLFTSQSKLQRGIHQFSVGSSKNSDSTSTETCSSVPFLTGNNNLQTKKALTTQNLENEVLESPFNEYLESPQSCHSEDLFLSSFEESSQESKPSKKSQEDSADVHLPKCENLSSPEQFSSKDSPVPSLDIDLIPEKSLEMSPLGDNEEILSFSSEIKQKYPSPIVNVSESDTVKSYSLNSSLSDEHKEFLTKIDHNKPMLKKEEIQTTKEITMETSQTNQDSKPSTSVSKPKPSSSSSDSVSFTKISSGVPQSKFHSSSAKTAREPNYLKQFYNNSRLHHLSTWKVQWKNYVSEIKARVGKNFPGRQKLMSSAAVMDANSKHSKQQIIMHIDMDSFFVSVALRDQPELKDKPVGVTHSQKRGPSSDRPGVDVDYERQEWIKRRKARSFKGKTSTYGVNATVFDEEEEEEDEDPSNRTHTSTFNSNYPEYEEYSTLDMKSKTQAYQSFSEIASCNYVARKAGLKNGMFIGDALKLCPNLITLPYEFEKYQEVSKILYDTVMSYTHDIEAVSCDEMLVDLTSLLQETGADVKKFVSMLRQEIFEKTRCTASAGLSTNILLARLATHKAKPNGHFLVENDQIDDFIKEQTINNLPGVGKSMMYKLEHLHVKTCGDLQRLSLPILKQEFGPKTGQLLYNYCRGKDDRSLQVEYNQKSVSAEINYGIRFNNDNDMDEFLEKLSSEVESRLKKANKRGKTISLKLMVRRPDAPSESAKYMGHGLCNNLCKSMTLAMATDQASVISKKCMSMYKALKLKASDLRGIGISIHRLESIQSVGPSYGFESTNPKNCNILKFTKAISSKTFESDKSPPRPSTSYSLTQKDSDCLVYDAKQNIDFHLMKPVHIKQFGSIDFMEFSSQRKSGENFPPLPRLPSQCTLPQLQNLKLPSPKPEIEDFLPSPSQVDKDVLNELPDDIRIQIQVALKRKQKKKDLKSKEKMKSILSTDLDQPGCSHWMTATSSSDFVAEQLDTNVEEVINPVVHNISDIERELLPNLSQMDEGCFNELPEDIQQEMQAAMKQREIRKQDEAIALSAAKSLSAAAMSPVKMMSLHSPTKDSSPGKARGAGSKRKSPQKTKKSPNKKRSPHFKIPRGRPRVRRGIGSRTLIDARKKLFLYGNIDKKYPEKNTAMAPSIQPSDSPSQTPRIVSLCGAVTIAEVRKLLQEWLTTCSEPTTEDELFLVDYLKALIEDKNLEQVDLVLKFLYRNICQLNAENWFPSLQNIVEQVQKVVWLQYKSKLKLGFSLPIT